MAGITGQSSGINKALNLERNQVDTKTLIENDEELNSIKDNWPILSEKALPGIVGDFVSLATRNSEADPAAVLATFLVWFGAEIGPGIHMMVGDTKHFARLFAVIVGDTSKARKGTSCKPVERLFSQNSLNSLNKNNLWFPAKISPGPLSTGEGLILAVSDNNLENKNIGPENNDKRLIVLDEEFASALKCSKREGNTLTTIIRRFYDSGNVEPLTKSNKIKTTGAHVSIVTHITLEELHSNFHNIEIFSGLANRFLWICARRQKVLPNPEPMPEEELSKIRTEIIRLIGLVYPALEITLTLEAKQYWETIYPNLSKAVDGLFGSVVSRSEAQTLRLAMIYSILDGQKMIDKNHLESALVFWQYAYDSAFFIFEQRSENPLLAKILDLLNSGNMSATALYRGLGNNVRKEQLKEALHKLMENKQVGGVQLPASGKKPKHIYYRIKRI